MWPWRRRPESKPAPIPVWTPGDQWRSVPPIQRMVPDHPLVNPVRRFTSSLASWQNPSSLAPLGHSVDAAEPSGVVSDLATPLPDLPAAATPQRARPARSGGGVWSSLVSTVTGSGPVAQRSPEPPTALQRAIDQGAVDQGDVDQVPVDQHVDQPAADQLAIEQYSADHYSADQPAVDLPSAESTVDPVVERGAPEIVHLGPVPEVPVAADVQPRSRPLPVVDSGPSTTPASPVQRIEDLGLWEPAARVEPSTTDTVAEVLGARQDEPEPPAVSEPAPVRESDPADHTSAVDLRSTVAAQRDSVPETAVPATVPIPGPVVQRVTDPPPPVRRVGLGAPIIPRAPGVTPPVVTTEPTTTTADPAPVQRFAEPAPRPAEPAHESPALQPDSSPPAAPAMEMVAPPMVVSSLVGDQSPISAEHTPSTVLTGQSTHETATKPSPPVPTVSRLSTTEAAPIPVKAGGADPKPVTVSRAVVGLGAPLLPASGREPRPGTPITNGGPAPEPDVALGPADPATLPIQRMDRSIHTPSPVSATHRAAPRTVPPSPTATVLPQLPPVVQREVTEPAPAEAALPEAPPAPESPVPDAAAPAPPSATAAAPAAPGTPGAPGTQGQAGQEPEELLKKLYDPLLRRLKTELRLDRERRGALTDRWH